MLLLRDRRNVQRTVQQIRLALVLPHAVRRRHQTPVQRLRQRLHLFVQVVPDRRQIRRNQCRFLLGLLRRFRHDLHRFRRTQRSLLGTLRCASRRSRLLDLLLDNRFLPGTARCARRRNFLLGTLGRHLRRLLDDLLRLRLRNLRVRLGVHFCKLLRRTPQIFARRLKSLFRRQRRRIPGHHLVLLFLGFARGKLAGWRRSRARTRLRGLNNLVNRFVAGFGLDRRTRAGGFRRCRRFPVDDVVKVERFTRGGSRFGGTLRTILFRGRFLC
uniref:(northern house mosquito) hypothetical protein n=1 Tax=Culex pipiens TaxID=7175 RepID=A0A8D8BLD5_CULPI